MQSVNRSIRESFIWDVALARAHAPHDMIAMGTSSYYHYRRLELRGNIEGMYDTFCRLPCQATSQLFTTMQECISCIHQNNIRLVCFDFDQTAYRGHTGGTLSLSIDDVAHTLRNMVSDLSQDFLALVGELHKENVHVAIVTFGDAIDNQISLEDNQMILGGELLLRPVLNMGLNRQTEGKIPIYALNPDWRNNKGEPLEFPDSKEWHLGQAMKHFGIHQPGEVLLIDDSLHNISEAAKDGFRTVIVQPETAFTISQLLEQLVPKKDLD